MIESLDEEYHNLFDNIQIPRIEDLSTEPTIFGIVSNDSTNEIFIRLIYKSGVKSDMYGKNIVKHQYLDILLYILTLMIEYWSIVAMLKRKENCG